MKKLILLLLFIPLVSTAQIGKKKLEKEWNKLGKLAVIYVETSYLDINGIKTYKIEFQNQQYRTISDICTIIFTATDEEIKYLKDFLIEGTKLKKDAPSMFLDIGNGRIQLDPTRHNEVVMWYTEKDWLVSSAKKTWFSKRQIDKLFPID